MKRIEKLTDGPLGVGARYRMAFTSGPPASGEVVRFERPSLWEMVGGSSILRSAWRGRVLSRSDGDGAHLVLSMEIQLRPGCRWRQAAARRRVMAGSRSAVQARGRRRGGAGSATA